MPSRRPRDGRHRQPELLGYLPTGLGLALLDTPHQALGRASLDPRCSRAMVPEPGRALRIDAPEPLVGGRAADARRLDGDRYLPSAAADPLDQKKAVDGGQICTGQSRAWGSPGRRSFGVNPVLSESPQA